MATVYTWQLPTLEYYPHAGGLNQVVHIIHWILNGSDGTHESSVYGTQTLKTDDLNPDQFVSFADLTQAVVEIWLEDAMGADKVQQLKDIVQNNINNMISPQNVMSNPPWDQ